MNKENTVTRDESNGLYYHQLGTDSVKDFSIADFHELEDPNLMM